MESFDVLAAIGVLLGAVLLLIPGSRRQLSTAVLQPAKVPAIPRLDLPAVKRPRPAKSTLKDIVSSKVIPAVKPRQPGEKLAVIVSKIVGTEEDGAESEHNLVIGAKREELKQLDTDTQAVKEQMAKSIAAVPAARAAERGEVIAKLQNECDFSVPAVAELHALGPPMSLAIAEPRPQSDFFVALLDHVKDSRDIAIMCGDGGKARCDSAVLRATSQVLSLALREAKVPENSDAFGLLARMLHADESSYTLADLAQVLPLLRKYACTVLDTSVRDVLRSKLIVDASAATALQVLSAVAGEDSELELRARKRVVELFPFPELSDTETAALRWPVLEHVLSCVVHELGHVKAAEDLRFLNRWYHLAAPGHVPVLPFLAVNELSHDELKMVFPLLAPVEFAELAERRLEECSSASELSNYHGCKRQSGSESLDSESVQCGEECAGPETQSHRDAGTKLDVVSAFSAPFDAESVLTGESDDESAVGTSEEHSLSGSRDKEPLVHEGPPQTIHENICMGSKIATSLLSPPSSPKRTPREAALEEPDSTKRVRTRPPETPDKLFNGHLKEQVSPPSAEAASLRLSPGKKKGIFQADALVRSDPSSSDCDLCKGRGTRSAM